MSVPISSRSSRKAASKGRFARVDSALRHLPGRQHRHVDASADKHLARARFNSMMPTPGRYPGVVARHTNAREAALARGRQFTTRPLNSAMPRSMSTARAADSRPACP